jgi:hypothetical protein
MLYRRVRRGLPESFFLAFALSVLLGQALVTPAGATIHYASILDNRTAIIEPPIILQNGTVGTSTIYTNNTSAKVSVAAPKTNETEGYVDNNTSNIDNSTDKGIHSNFTALQYGPDLIYDTLAETSAQISVKSFGNATIGGSTQSVSAPQTIVCKFTAPEVGDITSITIWLSGSSLPSGPKVVLYSDSAGSPSSLLRSSATFTPAGGWNAISITAYSMSAGEVLWLGVAASGNNIVYAYRSGTTNQLGQRSADAPNPFGTPTFSAQELSVYANYSTVVAPCLLDLEVQWTNVDYDETNEYLCIYGGTMGSENITVDVWNGAAWQSLFTDLSTGWNNVSISSYLTSSNFTIRFRDGNENGDVAQDSWNIDVALLHVWTFVETTYDYTLKVNNTVTGSWEIMLKEYSDSSVGRLQNCTIYFHNSTDGNSPQITVENGSFKNEIGSWYNLGSSQTIYIAITVEASSTGTSYIHAYLEVRIPNTTTYAQYIITFEIT